MTKSGSTLQMYDFYIRMKDQYAQFNQKQERLEKSKEYIHQVIVNVESLKNLTIQECLKKLQHKFETFFKIFVENGRAKIKLIKDVDVLREEPQTEAR